MNSEVRTFSYPNGEIQRVQLVRLDSWQELAFHKPKVSAEAIDSFARIYQKFLVPACPVLFGTMVLFRLPEDMEIPFPYETARYGQVTSPLTAAAATLEQGVYFLGKTPLFRNKQTRTFYRELERQNCIRIVRGWLPITTIIPVGDLSGFLTESEENARMKVDASFFIMDRFDCATAQDHLGFPFGLRVKDGTVESPPAYGREALLVHQDGSIQIRPIDVRELELEIRGNRYRHGRNTHIYDRPRCRVVRGPGKKVAICGNTVASVSQSGSLVVPTSGFVMRVAEDCDIRPGDQVTYHGLSDVAFGVQVGNSILRNGVKTEKFLSRFYNIRHFQPVPYPPSLYPMNFKAGRAARIALGADAAGKPMLLWAEGAGKLRYTPGVDSCGASLSEMAEICEAVGMVDAINLDGGGSAQILLNNNRSLQISDRQEEDNSECERPIPMGLIVP